MMQKSMTRVILAGWVTAILLAGCGAKPTAQPQVVPQEAHTSDHASHAAAPQPQAPQPKTASIQTYFGDENGTALVTKQTTITYASEGDKYAAALNALKQSGDNKAVALFEGFTFKSATFEQGKLKLDLKLDDQGRLGAEGEQLMLQALKKTLFQFTEVAEIYVTVDGKKVESLMGHLELPYPVKRNE